MRSLKKLLSIVLSVAMMVTTLTATPVFAEDNVCHIGDTYYATLEAAIAAYNAQSSKQTVTIELDADCTITKKNSLSKIDLTINGNNHTITSSSSSSDSYRGLQTNSTSTLTLNNVNVVNESSSHAVYVYAGSVTCNNVNFEGGSRAAFTFYTKGTAAQSLTLSNCTFADYSTAPVQINSSYAKVSMSGVSFADCSGTYEVNATAASSISIGGTTTIKKLYLASEIYVTPLSDLDSSSYIGLCLDSPADGTQVLTGDYVSSKYSVFKISGSSNLSIGSDGCIKTKKVAKWNGTEYETLAEAISDATASGTSVSNRTITIIDDVDVDSRISIGKTGVVITDDGNPRTIYIHNTDTTSDGGYGRGIQFSMSQESYKLTFMGTSKGNLTIVGHSEDESSYNAGELFHIRGGMLYLTNVIIKDCVNSMSGASTKLGGAVYVALTNDTYRGSVTVNNCEISNCQAAEGSAIYSLGGSVILTSTSIHDCASKSDSGAVAIHDEPGDVTSDLSHNGILKLNTTVEIYDNYKNTTLSALTSGTESNVSVEDGDQIIINANLKYSNIGIDYGNDGDVFADNDSGYGGYSITTIHRDGNTDLKPKKSGSYMVWTSYGYEVTWGDYTTISQSKTGITTYQYKSAAVTADSSGAAVSVAVDKGSFSLDWSALSLSGITKYEAVLADGTFASGDMPTTGTISYKGVTLYGTITTTKAATFVKALVFTNTGSNIVQNIYFGIAEKINEGEQYFAGSKYVYTSSKLTWDNANSSITEQRNHLAYINGKTENDYVTGITGGNVWTGAEQRLNAWYWSDGTKFAANATTNEGYGGAYVNWAAGQPDGSGESMIVNASGKWECVESTETYGYVTEKTDSSKVTNPVSIAAAIETSTLTSMNLSFDGDISMYYYFIFADSVTDEYTVVVEVGETGSEDYFTVSSTVAEMKNLTDSQGDPGIKVPVPAKMMGADIKIRLCNETGAAIRTYANYDGNHADKNYNCLYYANYMLGEHEDRYNEYYSENLISMIKAMLNYGAAAQAQFTYDTDNLVNAGYEDTSAVLTEIPSDDITAYTGTNFSSAALIAESETVMALTYTGTGSQPTVSFDGVQTTNFTYENKVIKIPVSAQNLGKTCEITIGSDYAILNTNYLLNVILTSSESTDAQKLTCDRLYKFGKAADEYFGVYQQNTNAIEAILETAYAYLSKNVTTQYDQYKLDTVSVLADVPQGRRQLFASPEEMTDYHNIYLDCSSFCFNVYNNVFGSENTLNAFIRDYSDYREYENFQTRYITYGYNYESLVKLYSFSTPDSWDSTTDMSTYEAEWTEAIEEAKSIMQPGDLIAYYGYNASGNSGGHILLWTGSGLIHCTGSDYDYDSGTDNVETNGAVQYLTPSEFDYTYLKKHGAQRAVIIRPLNVLEEETVLDSAIARTQLGSIAVESTAVDSTTGIELYQGQYVNNGDTVTYTITITNKQMSGNFTVNKEVDVTFTPSTYLTNITTADGGTYSNGKITWSNVELKVDGTVELNFTGTVSGEVGSILDGGTGEIKLSDAGSAAKALTFENEEAEIESALPSDFATKLASVKSNASDYVGADGASTVNAILRYITSDDTKSIGEDDDAVMDTIRTITSLGNYRPLITSYWDGNLVSNFCGGRKFFMSSIDNGPFSYTDRVRNITVENLKVGDIIMTYRESSDLTDYYIYLGEDSMLNINTDLETSEVSASTICERLNGRSLWGIFRLTK